MPLFWLERAKNRVDKIFADYRRDGFGATTVVAWSGMGVSVQLAWDGYRPQALGAAMKALGFKSNDT